MNFTSLSVKWNESSSGVSLSLKGMFSHLSASISVAECMVFDKCKTVWDNTDACCGEDLHFEIDLIALCGSGGSMINSLDVLAVRFDKIKILEPVLGRRVSIATITAQLESTIIGMIKKQLPMINFLFSTYINSHASMRKLATALCQTPTLTGSVCRAAVENAPLKAKGLMFFAMGKQFYDQGAFSVCKEIPRHADLTNFTTKHFTVSYSIEGIPAEIGLCLPSVCKNEDILGMLKYFHAKEPLSALIDIAVPSYALGYPQPKGTVRHPNPVNDVDDVVSFSDGRGSPSLTPLAFAVLTALVFLAGFSTHITRKEMRRRQVADSSVQTTSAQPADALAHWKVIRAFSLVGPDGTWTSLWQRSSYRPTDCLNGLRVISMIWIILGHSFAITGGCAGFYNVQDVVKNVLNPDAAATSAAWPLLDMPGLDLAVDTFFFISGFLASFVGSTRETPFVKGVVNRYLRLAPCLAFALMIYTLIMPFLVVGPFAPRYQDAIFRRCHAWTWWTPLLFIMNFLPWYNDDVCMGWTWYLGNDMIFAIIGIALLNLWKWGHRSGWLATTFITISSFVVTFWLICHYNLGIIDDPRSPHGSDYQYYLYDKPWSRIPAFLVGLVVPWVLLWAKDKYGLQRGTQPRSARAVVLARIAFMLALGVIFFLLFITYTDQDGGFGSSKVMSNWSTEASATYLTFGRPLWACAHAVIALACYFDYIPFVNGFLSHWLWSPLTRLTYNAYLFHPLMINFRCGLAVQYYQFTTWTLLQNLLIDSTLAYVCAAVAWCLVEKPAATLTTFLLAKPRSRSGQPAPGASAPEAAAGGTADGVSLAQSKSFAVGDRVQCKVDDDRWSAGTVIKVGQCGDDRSPQQPGAPYQVQLADGNFVSIAQDTPDCIKADSTPQ